MGGRQPAFLQDLICAHVFTGLKYEQLDGLIWQPHRPHPRASLLLCEDSPYILSRRERERIIIITTVAKEISKTKQSLEHLKLNITEQIWGCNDCENNEVLYSGVR